MKDKPKQAWPMKLLPLWIFLGFSALLTLLYREVIGDLPRADHVVFIANFLDQGIHLSDIKRTLFFEFFGTDKRFQPLAFPLVYFQWKLYGTQFFLYHLTNIALHSLNATLLFILVKRFTNSILFSLFIAAAFLTAATHLDIIAWTVHFYVLSQLTLLLLAFLSLVEWQRRSNSVYLYLAYLFILIQMFLTELGVVFPLLLFIASITLQLYKRGPLHGFARSFALMCTVYAIFLIPFLLFLASDPRALPGGLLTIPNLSRAISGTITMFANTAFLHNVLASAKILCDDAVFFLPVTWQLLSPTGGTPVIQVIGNILSITAIIILLVLARKPKGLNWMPFLLVLSTGIAATFLLMLARPVSYAISQSRYTYLPVLTLVACLALLYTHYFNRRVDNDNVSKSENSGLMVKSVILAMIAFFIALNVIKTLENAQLVAETRAHARDIYYTAREFISQPENKDAKLFISVPTYPQHEKLGWGMDIIPDLFLASDPRITKNVKEATHILQPGPRIDRVFPKSPVDTGSRSPDESIEYHKVMEKTGNLIANEGFRYWSNGPGPFTQNGQMWADGWLIDLQGDSSISVTREAHDDEIIAAVDFYYDVESYLTFQLPDASSLSGKIATYAMAIKTNEPKAVRLGVEVDGTRIWSDFHPGDGAWHTMSLTLPMPDNVVKGTSLHIALGKIANTLLSRPSVIASLKKTSETPTLDITGEGNDFTVTFGFLTRHWPETPLEMFGFTNETVTNPQGWYLRLLYDLGRSSQPEYTTLVLGYRNGGNEIIAYYSQPIATTQWQMNHFVLGRENGTFYLILNGRLHEKFKDESGLKFRNMELPIGEVYTYTYPYFKYPMNYFAHTFVQIGSSRYSVSDKELGYKYDEIKFDPHAFMPYHLSLNW